MFHNKSSDIIVLCVCLIFTRFVAENKTEKFVTAVGFTVVEPAPSIELRGDRQTKLGLDM